MANVKGKDNYEVMPQIDGVDIVPSGGTIGQVLAKDSSTDYDYSWQAGGGSPGGADGNIQYNNGGAFGGEANLSYDDVNDRLVLDNGGSNKAEIDGNYIQLPGGNTASRPTAVEGMIRYNTETQKVEAYENSTDGWINFRQEDVILARYAFYADQVEYPVTGSDWDITTGSPASSDSNNSSITVRLFDDTTQEAIGMNFAVPSNATSMTVITKARAETAPGASQVAVMLFHKREIPDNAAIGTWSNNTLMNITLPTNENFQFDSTTQDLATWGMTAGSSYQIQVSRNAGDVSDTLVGDLALYEVEFIFQ